VDEPVLDLQPHAHVAPVVAVRPSRVSRVLGSPFTGRQILAYLQPLGFELLESARTDEAEEEERLWLRVPGPRAYDVSREIDLVEEVARRHGYDAFPQQLAAFRPSSVPEDRLSRLEDRIRAFLVGVGYLEARGAAFAPESGGDVALLNPLSSAESRLRRDLLPGLVARLEHNFARGTRNVRLFEIGTVFHATPDRAGLPLERNRLALIFTGARHSPHWSERVQPFDIWDLKGLLERLAPLVGSDLVLEVAHNEQRHGDADLFERGQSLVLTDDHGRTVARGGKLRPGVVDSPAWADDVFGVEVELVASEPAARQRVFRTLPAFPGIERDLALLVPDPVPAGEVEGQIRVAAGALLESVSPFDLYAGKGIPGGVRSIAFRLRFRAKDRTLKDAEADEAVARVLRALKEVLGVERRG
jgi:phenylalanyl-tRNA synthetase beta chain